MLAVIRRAREARVYNTIHRAKRNERVQETSGYTTEPSQERAGLKKPVVTRIRLAKRDGVADKKHKHTTNQPPNEINRHITACVHRP